MNFLTKHIKINTNNVRDKHEIIIETKSVNAYEKFY